MTVSSTAVQRVASTRLSLVCGPMFGSAPLVETIGRSRISCVAAENLSMWTRFTANPASFSRLGVKTGGVGGLGELHKPRSRVDLTLRDSEVWCWSKNRCRCSGC